MLISSKKRLSNVYLLLKKKLMLKNINVEHLKLREIIHLMVSIPHCRKWEKKTLKEIHSRHKLSSAIKTILIMNDNLLIISLILPREQ